jgi:hypothetical protein
MSYFFLMTQNSTVCFSPCGKAFLHGAKGILQGPIFNILVVGQAASRVGEAEWWLSERDNHYLKPALLEPFEFEVVR